MAPQKFTCVLPLCSKPIQRIVGDRSLCASRFCAKHRLPEQHSCTRLEVHKKKEFARNAEKLLSERTVVSRGL
ncbi:uncharacterized protein BDZ99DRAFT_401296 [Mytilinidion resinicola]|uniref:AN1-type domain-containing protein n=1 Tax=Mytilinidion resinicola TaxID=574789 RepID=A0A6A6Y256_9PEZI|nr:uncharacterized protein BDZ99DRAFT_401296 [Mytilinidion resinicola]KAF2802593.1 hypothetical protein BDZ99DRAFT_401296 [Mytilinidion resinicola]